MTTLNQFLKDIFKTKVEQLGSKYFFKILLSKQSNLTVGQFVLVFFT